MPTYLITGVRTGLGYGFVEVLARDPANTVIGIVRDKEATEKKLAADGIEGVKILEADINDLPALKVSYTIKSRQRQTNF